MSILAIEFFQAKQAVRTAFSGEVASQEWRIPEYSYVLNVPLAFRGRKSTEEKALDDLRARLSVPDRKVYDRLFPHAGGKHCVEAALKPVEEMGGPYDEKLKALEQEKIKALEARDFKTLSQVEEGIRHITNELFGQAKPAIRAKLRQCLTEAGMSKDGADLVTSYLLSSMRL